MWEAFRSADFLEQVELCITLYAKWALDEKASDKQLLQYKIDDGLWETLRTVLNNTFLKRGKTRNFLIYFVKFIRYSFALNRKWIMIKTISRLPLLRAKEFMRLIVKGR